MTTPLQHTSIGELGGYNPLLSTSVGELSSVGIIVPPELPGGGSSERPRHGPSSRDIQIREQILRDDEEIIAVLHAFLRGIQR